MVGYPKIETLFARNEHTHRVISGEVRCPEFNIVSTWHVTEKIDGTNIRVGLMPDGSVRFEGRSDRAQMYPGMLVWLKEHITAEALCTCFEHTPDSPEIILFGEGYGPKIQKGGGGYRSDGPSFRLFDVLFGNLWLTQDAVADIAAKLGLKTVPVIAREMLWGDAADMVQDGFDSIVAQEDGGTGRDAEGVVARSEPLLRDRRGNRVMWKLKTKDFES